MNGALFIDLEILCWFLHHSTHMAISILLYHLFGIDGRAMYTFRKFPLLLCFLV